MSPLEITTAGWYNLFYTLAVGVAAWVTFDAGRRRGWSAAGWSVAVGAWVAGGVVGAMLPHLVFGDAVAFRTSIGAVIFASLAIALAAPLAGRTAAEALDTTTVAIPLGAAIVRIGCFLAGCCEGTIYEALLEGLLAAAIARRAASSRAPVRFTTMVAAMCAIRFATEFLRDNDKFAGLSLAQWIVLPAGIVCVMLLAAPARANHARRTLTPAARRAAIALVGAFAIVALVVELPALEASVLMLGAAAMIVVAARRACRVAPAGLAALALQVPAISADTTWPRQYMFFGGGLNAGQWESIHESTSCDGPTERWSRSHSAFGASLEMGTRRQHSPTNGAGFRVRGYFGNDRAGAAVVTQGTATAPGPYSVLSSGLTAVADLDWEFVGLSGGFSMGQFYPMLEDSYVNGRAEPFRGFPAAGIRIGRLRGVSFETRLGDESPMWIPAPVSTVAVGFGDSLGNRVRIGASESGLFIGGRRMTRSGFEILPSLVISGASGDGQRVDNGVHGGVAFRKWIRVSGPR